MLELLGGLFSLLFQPSPKLQPLQATNWSPWLDPVWVKSAVAPSPDPVAQLALQQHLAALAGMGLPSSNQAVWMQTGHQVLVAHQGEIPLPAASLTKVATTLAALVKWGHAHQFETVFSTNAPIQDGVLQGDLIVQGVAIRCLCGKKRLRWATPSVKRASDKSRGTWSSRAILP